MGKIIAFAGSGTEPGNSELFAYIDKQLIIMIIGGFSCEQNE